MYNKHDSASASCIVNCGKIPGAASRREQLRRQGLALVFVHSWGLVRYTLLATRSHLWRHRLLSCCVYVASSSIVLPPLILPLLLPPLLLHGIAGGGHPSSLRGLGPGCQQPVVAARGVKCCVHRPCHISLWLGASPFVWSAACRASSMS